MAVEMCAMENRSMWFCERAFERGVLALGIKSTLKREIEDGLLGEEKSFLATKVAGRASANSISERTFSREVEYPFKDLQNSSRNSCSANGRKAAREGVAAAKKRNKMSCVESSRTHDPTLTPLEPHHEI